jgi:uncharacterized protein
MPTYQTPGVYYERADAASVAIAPLRTDIAAFVGIARQGPIGTARPVGSWRQFVSTFGDFTGAGYLAYAVRAFFENGGRRCWVVRVASPATAAAGTMSALPSPFSDAWRVEAATPGVWGNDLDVEFHETHMAQTSAQPLLSTEDFVTVASVVGFERGTHVRAIVSPAAPAYRVVSMVDPDLKRLYWVHPRVAQRLPYEQTLTGYDQTRPLRIESVEYTLLVREMGRLTAVVEGLSLVPDHRRYAPVRLAAAVYDDCERVHQAPRVPAEVGSIDRPADDTPSPVVVLEQRTAAQIAALQPMAAASLGPRALVGGLDGLAPLAVEDYLGQPTSLFDDETMQQQKRRGLRAIEPIGEVALVAIPDIHIQPAAPPAKRPPQACTPDPCLPLPPPGPAAPRPLSQGDLPPRFSLEDIFRVQQALVDYCSSAHDRFALIDPPFEAVIEPRLGLSALRAWRGRFDADCAALYAPWLLVPDPLMLDTTGMRAIPPSGHVAGFAAQTDLRSGVHRAPANGALKWVQATTVSIDDAQHGLLNPEHINAIRAFPGRGLRIFGARTLSSDPDWRFVNVRRLMLMLEKAIRIGSQWAVFEPNDRATRAKLHLALTSLLLEMWRQGALAGRTVQEAFFVNCSEEQNPPDQRDRGMLVAEVGVAPASPFEFIVLRVGISDNSLEITERGSVEAVS